MSTQTRLSLDVKPHPTLEAARRRGDELLIAGELTIKGSFPVTQNLDHGDELAISITTADGELLTSGVLTIAGPPPLIPIESKDLGLIGYCRAHKAKVRDAQAPPVQ